MTTNLDTRVTWQNLGDCRPTNRRVMADPGESVNFDSGERTETTLESPCAPSGPLPQAARFTCGHGRTTLHLGTGTDCAPGPDDMSRITLYLHYWGFRCDCLRPVWRRLFGEDFGRRAMVDTYRWMRESYGRVLIGPVWHKRVGPPARSWRVRPGIVEDAG